MDDDELPLEKFACPCCGYATLNHLGRRHVCPVCYWEDDGSDNDCLDAESGWNNMTLRQARVNFLRMGVCDASGARYVRRATAEEVQRRRFNDQGEEIVPESGSD
ncbi:MAG TPA: CPCC family cysteine-rich protein [Kofleriaceae bacterium]